MKKYLLYLSALLIGLSACSKKYDSTPVPPFDEAAQAKIDSGLIADYLVKNPKIHATKHPSGLYYEIQTQGTGIQPTTNSQVTLEYKGETLKGNIFDQGTFTTLLNERANIIKGFKIGVPLVKTGGTILLIIPSALAYGQFDPGGGIGSNATLVFTVKVLESN